MHKENYFNLYDDDGLKSVKNISPSMKILSDTVDNIYKYKTY